MSTKQDFLSRKLKNFPAFFKICCEKRMENLKEEAFLIRNSLLKEFSPRGWKESSLNIKDQSTMTLSTMTIITTSLNLKFTPPFLIFPNSTTIRFTKARKKVVSKSSQELALSGSSLLLLKPSANFYDSIISKITSNKYHFQSRRWSSHCWKNAFLQKTQSTI